MCCLSLLTLSCQLVVALPLVVLSLCRPLVNSLRPSRKLVVASHCAALSSSCRASWLSNCLSPSSRCATLSSTCCASLLLHHLSLSSHCSALSSSCPASWLSHCLSLSSRCATLLSTRHASVLSHRLSSSSCCTPRPPLVFSLRSSGTKYLTYSHHK